MHLVLFDSPGRQQLYPFTYTRPIADIRCGIFTMRERWERFLKSSESGTFTVAYLQEVFPCTSSDQYLLVHGGVFATNELAKAITALNSGEALISEDRVIAARIDGALPDFSEWQQAAAKLTPVNFSGTIKMLERPWDIFSFNDTAIREDFPIVRQQRNSAPIPDGVITKGADIFIEDDAILQPGVILNAQDGPIYIGSKSEIMEVSMIRGPFVLCEKSVVKMGAKVYSGTTIGPGCKVGGEVNNVVFFANSNKGHDGFLGNAVIGEWCNLGADTNCSNLKNNYDEVKVWDESANKEVRTGLTFCGLLMGDHSKSGINTMFNTGTVAGVSCNIWGGGFPEKFIPSFSWGGQGDTTTYQFEKAMDTAKRMMARRGLTLSEAEIKMLHEVFIQTEKSRRLPSGAI